MRNGCSTRHTFLKRFQNLLKMYECVGDSLAFQNFSNINYISFIISDWFNSKFS